MKPLPSDSFYRLQINGAASGTGQWTDKAIRVAKFQASGIHRERAIVHTESGKFAVNQHRYHLWIDSPERMLQHELISYLRAARVAPTVSAIDTHQGGFEVVGRIRQFEQVRDGAGVRAVVTLDLELMSVSAPRTLIVSREYTESMTVSGDDAESTAGAISAAIAMIFQRFVTEAGAAL